MNLAAVLLPCICTRLDHCSEARRA